MSQKTMLHFFNIQIKKKKKIDLPTLPIFRPKGKQTFIFLGLICQLCSSVLGGQIVLSQFVLRAVDIW